MYDYYLQFSVSVVNAKTLKKMLGNKSSKSRRRRRKKRPIATVFFRFSHRDMDGNALKNKSQSSIVEIIKRDVMHKQSHYKMLEENEQMRIENEIKKECEEASKEDEVLNREDSPEKIGENTQEENKFEVYQSNTYIPYYDKIPKDMNQELADDEFELINEDDVLGSNPLVAAEADKNKEDIDIARKSSIDTKPLRLPKLENNSRFTPIMCDESVIMSETQIILIARLLPPLFRLREWKKVYSVDSDGISLQTFFKNAKGYSNSILFIEDDGGYKFGAYTTEDWKIHKHFYGTGESFLFTFRDTEEDVEFYKWSGFNEHIQYSDKGSIAVGGADGKFALYIRSNLYHGVSNK